MSKINGIDWSPFNDDHFATCAHDCCVKVCCFIAMTRLDGAGSSSTSYSIARLVVTENRQLKLCAAKMTITNLYVN